MSKCFFLKFVVIMTQKLIIQHQIIFNKYYNYSFPFQSQKIVHKMKIIFIFLTIFITLISTEIHRSFAKFGEDRNFKGRQHFYERHHCDDLKAFMKQFGKNHKISDDCNGENDHVAENFMANNISINEHNLRFKLGEETYTRSLSEHSDLNYTEKVRLRMGLDPKFTLRSLPKAPATPGLRVPPRVDWRVGSGFQPIKNQGHCGACWAFATVSVIEFMMRKAKVDVALSEQNLIDCDLTQNGCKGLKMEFN